MCSSEYFDVALILKRCVKPASAIVFACSNHLVDSYQAKTRKEPAERVTVGERENEEV